MKSLLDVTWKVAVARGVLGLILGLILVIWPMTALVFVLLWGIFILLDGVGWFATAFAKGQDASTRVLAIALGVLAAAAGIVAIFRPLAAVGALVIFLGIWLVVRGLIGAVVGLSGVEGRSRALVILGAVLDVLLGILFLINPFGSVTILVLLIGITTILWGVVFIAIGLMLRKGVQRFAGPAAPSASS